MITSLIEVLKLQTLVTWSHLQHNIYIIVNIYIHIYTYIYNKYIIVDE